MLTLHTREHTPNWICGLAHKYWFQTFPFWQFHVLFNSLFKVLFIFPSRYLFAIGLSPLFSFRWYLPPILDCIPKQSDSLKVYHMDQLLDHRRDCHPLRCLVPKDLWLAPLRKHFSKLQLGPKADFKFELFPLHSPLLGESLLVSFPPLNDMLKFSGYSCLIWDQESELESSIGPAVPRDTAGYIGSTSRATILFTDQRYMFASYPLTQAKTVTINKASLWGNHSFHRSFNSKLRYCDSSNPSSLSRGWRLKWFSNRHASRNTKRRNMRSKIRWFTILQFTLRIAFRCVLHRCESQEIRCQKLFFILNKS